MKKSVKSRPVIRRTSLAAGLLAALLSHGAAALVSTNTAGPVHGRQIVVTAAPAIQGTGVVGVPVALPNVPGVTDEDGDALTDWYYTWQIDGTDVGTEKLAGSISAIPAYTPVAGDSGKRLTLKLRAVADARSFPVATRFSAPSISNEITIEDGKINIGGGGNGGGGVIVDPNIPGSIALDSEGNGSGNENVEIKVNIGSSVVNNNPNPGSLEWTLEGEDQAQFTVDASGVLTLRAQDFENPLDTGRNNTYIVTVKVKDPATSATAQKKVTITVNNVAENATAVRVVNAAGVEITGNPVVGTTLHSAVTLDDNGGEKIDRADATYQWQRRNIRSTPAGEWTSITGATNATYTLTGADQGYEFRVDASGK